MKKPKTPFEKWQMHIREEQVRIDRELEKHGERREYGPQSRKEAAK